MTPIKRNRSRALTLKALSLRMRGLCALCHPVAMGSLARLSRGKGLGPSSTAQLAAWLLGLSLALCTEMLKLLHMCSRRG